MGFPSLGALLQVGVPALGGLTAGKNEGFFALHKLRQEDEERKREQQQQALQMALLQLQITKAQQPGEYVATTEDAAIRLKQAGEAPRKTIADELAEYTAKKKVDRQYPAPPEAIVPEWKRKGFPSFEAWDKAEQRGTGAPQQGERVAASLMPRADASDKILDAAPTPNAVQRGLSKIPFVGNYMANPEYQKYQQAGEQFITSILRPESGAQISESELETARRMFVPQPGDTPAVIAQKDAARTRAIEQLRTIAGRAAPAATATDAETDPISRAYRPENPFVQGAK